MCISFNRKTKFVGNGVACTEQGTGLPTAGTKYTARQLPTSYSAAELMYLYNVPQTTVTAFHAVI